MLRCPICNSENVRGFKVTDKNGKIWSQCVSGENHGTYSFGDNRSAQYPMAKEPWFTLDGDNDTVIITTPYHGDVTYRYTEEVR